MVSIILGLICLLGAVYCVEYDQNQAMISLYLSVATFCDIDSFSTRTFVPPTDGFVVTKTLNHPISRAIGFIGYLPSDKSIYIAIRGSSNPNNWISDMEVSKVNYTTFPDCNCEVAKGFYNAEQSIISIVIAEVTVLRKQFPEYAVKVTGHSYGAALSQLISMDLVAHGIPCSVYNFGQPRTGDANYSAYVKTKQSQLYTFRVVHNHDLVPHWPLDGDLLNYYHVCNEVFEDGNGNIKVCDDSCEDPSCSDQFKPWELRPEEHMTYLGLYISCDSVS